jgi:hypothetical protein
MKTAGANLRFCWIVLYIQHARIVHKGRIVGLLKCGRGTWVVSGRAIDALKMDDAPQDVAVNSPDHDAPAFSLHPSPSFALFPEHFIQEHFDHLFQRARFPRFKVGANDCLAVTRSLWATAPRRLILTRKPSTTFRDVCAPHNSALAFFVTYSLSCAVYSLFFPLFFFPMFPCY